MHTNRIALLCLAVATWLTGCTPPVDDGDSTTTTYHTVRRGETVSTIARQYGVPSLRVATDNRLRDPNRIQVGQRLKIIGTRNVATRSEARGESQQPAVRKVSRVTGTVKATGRFQWPLRGRVVRRYGSAGRGIAISASPGAPVLAADGGRVVLACNQMRGYGRALVLDHGNGYTTAYAHNRELLVGEGEAVRQGQAIARAGSTGRATSTRLEFRLYRHGVAQDPARHLR